MADLPQMFFVITVQYPGHSANTYTGTITPPPGATRQDLYEELFRRATEQLQAATGLSGNPVVSCWSLEPNGLKAGRG